MKRLHRLLAFALVILLAACIVAAYITRQISVNPTRAKTAAAPAQQIDQRLIQTADRLSALADTSDEQALGRDAVQSADHEVDQAFASALREATQPGPPPAGQSKTLADQVSKWTAQVAADKDRVDQLGKASSSSSSAGDRLELAKAQLALDQDELADAQQDLARQGGDQEANLERSFEQYEAAQTAAAQQKSPAAPATGTLSEQLRAWVALRGRKQQVDAAATDASVHAVTLRKAHDALDRLASHKQPAPAAADASAPAASDSGDSDQEDVAALIASLQHLSDQKKSMADLDERIEDSQHLAEVYGRWSSLLGTRERDVLHLLLNSLAVVLGIVLAAVLADGLVRKLFRHYAQARRDHHLRVASTVAIELIAASLIVLVVFGPPNQLSTIIGLTTAGLTVALKDFIVAFFGWFALMGRNGIRIGDWVEIRGVSGEVVEIGILKTIVLEMGNWGSTGSPTGRRVAFVNSFAIEDHYFNFSTAGQWFWDELRVSLPSTADPYRLSQQIRELVEHITQADAREAEEDWKRATHDENPQPFSAKPLADLQPSAGGLDVVVHYITHAPRRYQVKSQLLEAVVDLVHKHASGTEPAKASAHL